MGENARKLAEQFSLKRNNQEMLRIYEKITNA